MKTNFTKEHLEKFKSLAITFLLKGITVKGTTPASEYTVYDLIHVLSINNLTTIYSNLKSQIEKISGLDEWNLTDYQQKRQEDLKAQLDLVNLCIGYRKYRAEIASDKEKLAELKRKEKELKESTLSPEDKLKALQEEISSIESIEEL